MPRFVILRHELPEHAPASSLRSARASHFDFMLEQEGALWTWALDDFPSTEAAIPAERLADHRLAYLDYEGEVSGGRGTVRRVEWGEFFWAPHPTAGPVSAQMRTLRLELRGQRLRGRVSLTFSHGGAAEAAGQRWEFLFVADLPSSGLSVSAG